MTSASFFKDTPKVLLIVFGYTKLFIIWKLIHTGFLVISLAKRGLLQGGHRPGNQGNQGKVRDNKKWLK